MVWTRRTQASKTLRARGQVSRASASAQRYQLAKRNDRRLCYHRHRSKTKQPSKQSAGLRKVESRGKVSTKCPTTNLNLLAGRRRSADASNCYFHAWSLRFLRVVSWL